MLLFLMGRQSLLIFSPEPRRVPSRTVADEPKRAEVLPLDRRPIRCADASIIRRMLC